MGFRVCRVLGFRVIRGLKPSPPFERRCEQRFFLQPRARNLGPSWKEAEKGGGDVVRVFSHEGENQCTLHSFGPVGWLQAGLCLPMYGRSPEGLYASTHCLTQYGCVG